MLLYHLPLTPLVQPIFICSIYPLYPCTPGLGVKPVVGALDAITHAGDSVRAIVRFFTQEAAIPVYRQRFSSSFGKHGEVELLVLHPHLHSFASPLLLTSSSSLPLFLIFFLFLFFFFYSSPHHPFFLFLNLSLLDLTHPRSRWSFTLVLFPSCSGCVHLTGFGQGPKRKPQSGIRYKRGT